MKKTYVTSMPNHIGAFLKASKCFSALGINITRVSYNKAVDSHTLFIDAEGTQEQLKKADVELEKIGYLQNNGIKGMICAELERKGTPFRGTIADDHGISSGDPGKLSGKQSQQALSGNEAGFAELDLQLPDGKHGKRTEMSHRSQPEVDPIRNRIKPDIFLQFDP